MGDDEGEFELAEVEGVGPVRVLRLFRLYGGIRRDIELKNVETDKNCKRIYKRRVTEVLKGRDWGKVLMTDSPSPRENVTDLVERLKLIHTETNQ